MSVINMIPDKRRSNAVRDLMKLKGDPELIYLAGGFPDKKMLPTKLLLSCYEWALEQHGAYALEYGPTSGLAELKKQLVIYMEKKGIKCSAENILITSGSQQALDLISKEFIKNNNVSVQDPCYMGALNTFSKYTSYISSLSINKPDPEHTSLLYVNPDFSNPTGGLMKLADRNALIRRVHDNNLFIVEDGAYVDLNYDDKPLPNIISLDVSFSKGINYSRTLYCGSFSKSIAPGLRVGWVCAPAEIITQLDSQKETSDLACSSINQLVVGRLLECYYTEHRQKIRNYYALKKEAMGSILDKYLNDLATWDEPNGGFFYWVKFKVDLNSEKLMSSLVSKKKVAVVPGNGFMVDKNNGSYIRISFSQASIDDIETGIKRISDYIRQTDAIK